MNFRRIIHKTSSKSSSSSQKSVRHTEEISKLQCEIENLSQTAETLKISLESRDAAIGTLAREKEKIYVELKGTQRTNRNLHQQLIDERDIHSKEKEYLLKEIKRLSNKDIFVACSNNNLDDIQKAHQEELRVKDEVIYNICTKYLKIRESKELLQKKYEKLKEHNLAFSEKMMNLLQGNRDSMNVLINRLLKYSTIPPNSQKYLKLLKANADLHYENIQLKIKISNAQNMLLELQNKSESKNQNQSLTSTKNVNSRISNHLSKSKGKFKRFTESTTEHCVSTSNFKITSQCLMEQNKNNTRAIKRSKSDTSLYRSQKNVHNDVN